MKVLKYIGIAVAVLVLIPVLLIGVLALKPPKSRPPSDEKIQLTPERVERGKYLATAVGCLDCHSERDWSHWGGPIKPGRAGVGNLCLSQADGLPGSFCTPNLTPDPKTGLGSWTDGEVMRAIREGVAKDGHALFGMMPYGDFKSMSDDDVRAIVAYLRTLPPVENPIPPPSFDFPVNLLMKLGPQPLEGPIQAPPKTDTVAYGKYLATIACNGCHTPLDKGEPIPGMAFAGGMDFKGPWGHVRPANLTPDPETGIGSLTREQFLDRFRAFRSIDPGVNPAPEGKNSIMPWKMLSQMTDEDLGAIYDFLRTLPPVKHVVNRFPDAKG